MKAKPSPTPDRAKGEALPLPEAQKCLPEGDHKKRGGAGPPTQEPLESGAGEAAAKASGGMGKPAKVRELTVKAWEGPIDERELNREILRIIREDNQKQGVKEAELSRRYDMTRQHLHNILTEPDMTITIPLAAHWGNGRHLGLGYLVVLAEKSIRERHARAAARARKMQLRLP